VIDYFLISNPVDVVKKLVDVLGESDMHRKHHGDRQELVLGWALGASTGAVVGWALGAVRIVGEIMEPILNAINGIPKVAWPRCPALVRAGHRFENRDRQHDRVLPRLLQRLLGHAERATATRRSGAGDGRIADVRGAQVVLRRSVSRCSPV